MFDLVGYSKKQEGRVSNSIKAFVLDGSDADLLSLR
jgi:hypothetical protein